MRIQSGSGAGKRQASFRNGEGSQGARRLRFPCIVDRSLESPFRATPANELVSGAEGILLRLGRHVSNQWR